MTDAIKLAEEVLALEARFDAHPTKWSDKDARHYGRICAERAPILARAVKEMDLAFQSLTPGGSEYARDYKACLAFAHEQKIDGIEAKKDRARLRKELARAKDTIEGMEAEQAMMCKVLWKRGAEKYVRNNFPQIATHLAQQELGHDVGE